MSDNADIPHQTETAFLKMQSEGCELIRSAKRSSSDVKLECSDIEKLKYHNFNIQDDCKKELDLCLTVESSFSNNCNNKQTPNDTAFGKTCRTVEICNDNSIKHFSLDCYPVAGNVLKSTPSSSKLLSCVKKEPIENTKPSFNESEGSVNKYLLPNSNNYDSDSNPECEKVQTVIAKTEYELHVKTEVEINPEEIDTEVNEYEEILALPRDSSARLSVSEFSKDNNNYADAFGATDSSSHHAATHSQESLGSCFDCGKSFKLCACTEQQVVRECERCEQSSERKESLGPCLLQHSEKSHDNAFEMQSNLCRQVSHRCEEKTHSCNRCGKGFKRKGDLLRHLSHHSEERPHSCEHCKKAFKTKDCLSKHLSIHSEARPHSCSLCDKTFRTRMKLAKHLLSHPDDERKSDLVKHLVSPAELKHLIEHLSAEIRCDLCGKEFKSKLILREHRSVHMEERPHRCTLCDKTFKTKPQLRKHVSRHSDVKPHSCNHCEKSFKNKCDLVQHLLHHTEERPHSCEHCGKAFKSKGALSVHLLVHSEARPHPCPVCNKAFKTRTELGRHLLTHPEEQRRDLVKHRASPSKPKPVIEHLSRKYCCDRCGKAFKTKQTLREHLSVHTDDRPYNCTLCNSAFKTRQQLVKHVSRHSDEKPHSCDQCEKAFRTKDQLKRHLLRHSQEKPYLCGHCEKAFKRNFELVLHLTRYCEKKPPPCDQ